MKKLLVLLLAFTLLFSVIGCKPEDDGVMSYAEYAAADLDTEVVIEGYVQATQSWWDNKITVYLQDEDGAYFAYEMTCSEEDSAKLVKGQKIRVSGYKSAWKGEVEIIDCTFEVIEGNWIASAIDLTAKLGTDELINYQNRLVAFKNMTVKSVAFKGGEPGDDIYLTLTYRGNDYEFCVERYLTGPETDLYKTVSALKGGDMVDVEGFLYWYDGPNPHLTSLTVKEEGGMSYAEYAAAELDTEVVIEAYVQATQSWWDNKITVYLQDQGGAYFAYEMTCSEEDSAKLVKGQKIRVSGYKSAWKGEVEITDCTFEVVEGSWIAPATDLTAKLGTDELINYQNCLAEFKGLTVKSVSYKNNEPGDDIYVTFTYNGADYDFCVERYLTGPETDLYKTVGTLKAGDTVNVEGFLYWYDGPNPHLTAVTVVQ